MDLSSTSSHIFNSSDTQSRGTEPRREWDPDWHLEDCKRKLKNAEDFAQSIQAEYDQALQDVGKLRVENETLREQLDRAKRDSKSGCGDECPNLSEMSALRIQSTIKANKLQTMSADLEATRNEVKQLSDALDQLTVEMEMLRKSNQCKEEENHRMGRELEDLHEIKLAFTKLKHENDDLMIQMATFQDIEGQLETLSNENKALKAELEEMKTRETTLMTDLMAARKENSFSKETSDGFTNKSTKDIENKLQALAKENSTLKSELDASKSNETALNLDLATLREQYAFLEESQKRILDTCSKQAEQASVVTNVPPAIDNKRRSSSSFSLKHLPFIPLLVVFLLSRVVISYVYDEPFTLFGTVTRGVPSYMSIGGSDLFHVGRKIFNNFFQ